MGRLAKILIAAAVMFAVVDGDAVLGVTDLDWKECEQRGNTDTAIRACTRIISGPTPSKEDLVAALAHRGAAYAARRDHSRAIADFSEAIRLRPSQPSLHLRRAGAWLARGALDKALADYNAALRLDPLDAKALLGRAQAWEAKGDKEKAKADYRAVQGASALKSADRKVRETAAERLAALEKAAASGGGEKTAAPTRAVAPTAAAAPTGTTGAVSDAAQRAAPVAPLSEFSRPPGDCPRRAEDLEDQLNAYLKWVDGVTLEEFTRLRASTPDPCTIDRSHLQKMQTDIEQQSTALNSNRIEFYQTCTEREMTKLIDEVKKREPKIDAQSRTIILNRTSILHGRLEKLSTMQVLAAQKKESIIKLSARMKNLSEWSKDVIRDCSF